MVNGKGGIGRSHDNERPESAVSDDNLPSSDHNPAGNPVGSFNTRVMTVVKNVGSSISGTFTSWRRNRRKKRNKHQRLTSALNKSSDTGDAER